MNDPTGQPWNDRIMEEIEPQVKCETFRLTLYAAEIDAGTEQLAAHIREWFAEQGIPLTLAIVDILVDLERAIQDRVFATPMLVRHSPPPARRVIGDLSVITEVMHLLQISRADRSGPLAVSKPSEPLIPP